MSACAADYARCLANPFSGPLACIPDFPVLHSSKQRVWIKGSFSTGTSGIGYVIMTPEGGCINDAPALWYSSAAYIPTTVDIADVNTVAATTNSQYPTAGIGNTRATSQYRVVGAGIRIRYMGTELNRGGFKIGVIDPTHDTLNASSVVSMRAEPTSVEFAVGREWSQVLYRPVFSDELQFASVVTNVPYMGFMVQAASAATPLQYEFEYAAVYEYQGRNIRGMTPSHSDPTGFAAVNASSLTNPALIPNKMPDQKRETLSVQSAAHYVSQGVSSVSSGLETAKSIAETGAKVAQTAGSWWSTIEEIFDVASPLLFLL